MKNLTYDELSELSWLVSKQFEVVWSRYVSAVSIRQYMDADVLKDFRDDVLQNVRLQRKLRSIRLSLL